MHAHLSRSQCCCCRSHQKRTVLKRYCRDKRLFSASCVHDGGFKDLIPSCAPHLARKNIPSNTARFGHLSRPGVPYLSQRSAANAEGIKDIFQPLQLNEVWEIRSGKEQRQLSSRSCSRPRAANSLSSSLPTLMGLTLTSAITIISGLPTFMVPESFFSPVRWKMVDEH